MDNEISVFFITIGVIISILYFGIKHISDREEKENTKFMTECLVYHKQYECTLMWRSGENREKVIPMPVYISNGH